jgi:Bacterial transcriptional regulator
MDGLCAISAPMFDSDGEVHYYLTVTLTPFRLQVKGREKLFNLVKEAAKSISQKMGAPVIKSKSNSAREPREICNGSDKRIEKKRMFV